MQKQTCFHPWRGPAIRVNDIHRAPLRRTAQRHGRFDRLRVAPWLEEWGLARGVHGGLPSCHADRWACDGRTVGSAAGWRHTAKALRPTVFAVGAGRPDRAAAGGCIARIRPGQRHERCAVQARQWCACPVTATAGRGELRLQAHCAHVGHASVTFERRHAAGCRGRAHSPIRCGTDRGVAAARQTTPVDVRPPPRGCLRVRLSSASVRHRTD